MVKGREGRGSRLAGTRHHHPEAEVDVPEPGHAPVPVRAAQESRSAVPRPAPGYPRGAARWLSRIPEVEAPLPDIAGEIDNSAVAPALVATRERADWTRLTNLAAVVRAGSVAVAGRLGSPRELATVTVAGRELPLDLGG